jgi:hypothetical protein
MNKSIPAILIIFLLIIGCGGAATTPKAAKKQTYDGFMEWKAGMWTETTVKEGSNTLKIKTELLENSPGEARFQITTDKSGKYTIAQMWYNPATGKVTKYILKDDAGIQCMDASDAPKKRIPITGDDYPAGAAGVTLAQHTTTSGKELTAAKFPTKDGEVLVSSEVPFGMVKAVANSKTMIALDDFGTIGARDALSEEEIAQCEEKESAAKPAEQETAEEDKYTPSAEETEAESIVGEGTSYEAEAIDTRVGEKLSFDCAKCDEMPNAMAKNTCLLSCK